MEDGTRTTPRWGDYLDYSTAERYAMLSRDTLRKLFKRGEIRAVRVGTAVRIVRASLGAYLLAHAWTPPGEDDRAG